VLLNQGAGTFGSPTFYDHSGQTIGGVAAADFNGDGLTDILVANMNDDSFSILFAAAAGAALRASPLPTGVAASWASSGAPLTVNQLPALADAAIQHWSGAGLGNLDVLRHINWRIADLGGDALGLAVGNTITLDDDAAGHGWFVDATPADDAEFDEVVVDGVLRARTGRAPAERMDLLTVVLHELGHVAGLGHVDDGLVGSLMSARLEAGIRRLPAHSPARTHGSEQ
jgi:hypothetical protein